MRTKPDQKKIAVIILCIFLALMIAFVCVWTVKFKNSRDATRAAEAAKSAETVTSEDESEEKEEETAANNTGLNITALSGVMYSAAPEITLRCAPASESEIMAKSIADEITVTGKCDNGWYRAVYEGKVGFCYGKNLSDNKADALEIKEVRSDSKKDLPYYITVNRTQNTVTVYKADSFGEYTVPYKAMVCSVGKDDATPLGTYTLSDKFLWAWLSGDVCGQYVTRITGPYLFHSVPYFSQSKSDLEYEEYNKLGSPASLGCVRMAVIDVKWVYEECPKGTVVTIYDSDEPEPLPRPEPIRIDLEDERKGWDPTDPDPKNPWN